MKKYIKPDIVEVELKTEEMLANYIGSTPLDPGDGTIDPP